MSKRLRTSSHPLITRADATSSLRHCSSAGVAKDSNASLGNRAEAAKDFVSDKVDQNKHEGKAEVHEQKLKH